MLQFVQQEAALAFISNECMKSADKQTHTTSDYKHPRDIRLRLCPHGDAFKCMRKNVVSHRRFVQMDPRFGSQKPLFFLTGSKSG